MITTINEFKKIFENWYHGSDYQFSTFKEYKSSGLSALGIFVTDDKSLAELFGENIYDVNINIKNPKRISMDKWDSIRGKHAKDTAYFENMRNELIAEGYDSLFIKERTWTGSNGIVLKDGNIVVIFDPENITINKLEKITETMDKQFYHGSPYEFESFDLSKIGTGDGLNKYGFGLYFSDSVDTAKYYAGVSKESMYLYTVRLLGLEKFFNWDEQITDELYNKVIHRLDYLDEEDAKQQIQSDYEDYGDLWNMESLYEFLTGTFDSQKKASDFLVFCDVNGIITRNPMLDGKIYVSFRDEIIKIDEITKL